MVLDLFFLSKKKVLLKLDNSILKGLLDILFRRNFFEFTEMRYIVCIVEFDDFLREGYILRFVEMNREC